MGPDLLIKNPQTPHIGSLDVDLALNVERLAGRRYAELLTVLLNTRRYHRGNKGFQLYTAVDLHDGEKPVRVDVEFLAPTDINFKKNKPKLLAQFRVLQADGCRAAFHNPTILTLEGPMVSGIQNTVRFQIASLPDFLIMKAFALNGRDKPKDAYDICYCLESAHVRNSIQDDWRARKSEQDVVSEIGFLKEKFNGVESFGPQQVVEFFNSTDEEERLSQARRAMKPWSPSSFPCKPIYP